MGMRIWGAASPSLDFPHNLANPIWKGNCTRKKFPYIWNLGLSVNNMSPAPFLEWCVYCVRFYFKHICFWSITWFSSTANLDFANCFSFWLYTQLQLNLRSASHPCLWQQETTRNKAKETNTPSTSLLLGLLFLLLGLKNSNSKSDYFLLVKNQHISVMGWSTWSE